MTFKPFKKGVTLLETVIYIAILALVSVLVINSILIMIRSFNSYRVLRHVNITGAIAMERITREIRFADTIDVGSIFETHPGRLVLQTIDPVTENPATIDFFMSGNDLMFQKGGESAVSLTPGETELTNLIFREVATSTNSLSKVVKIELTVKEKRGSYEKSANFYNTTILRRSY